jgi:hypothetical protein
MQGHRINPSTLTCEKCNMRMQDLAATNMPTCAADGLEGPLPYHLQAYAGQIAYAEQIRPFINPDIFVAKKLSEAEQKRLIAILEKYRGESHVIDVWHADYMEVMKDPNGGPHPAFMKPFFREPEADTPIVVEGK